MRQFVKLLRRERLRFGRELLVSKPLPMSPVVAVAPAHPKDRRRVLSRGSLPLRAVLGQNTTDEKLLIHGATELRRPILLSEAYTGLSVMERSAILHDELRRRKESLKMSIETALSEQTEIFNNALSSRRQRLHELFRLRRKKMREFLQLHKDDIEEALILQRMLLQEALLARRERLRKTEQKIMEQGRLIVEDLRETKNKVKERMDEVIEKENIYTIPNLLCVTRIVFSPYLGYLIVTANFQYALAFMVVASFTDWVDGLIARNFKSQSTKIGSFLDPMADKVLIGTLFLTLTYVDLIPVALTALIVGRDLALVGAGFVIRYKSLPPPRTLSRYFDATHATAQLAPTFISKINTGVQLAFVGCTLAAPVFDYVGHPALSALCYITATTTVLSALSYLTSKHTYKYLNQRQ